MKKVLSMLLAVTLLLAMFVPAASAAGDYAGKTVLIYTGNLRGDVDVYAKIAAAKAEYEAQDANVVLVSAGLRVRQRLPWPGDHHTHVLCRL